MSGQMRILHIIHTLNRGGMESRIMDLYRNLDHYKYQYDFYIGSGNKGMYDEEVKGLGGRIYYANGKQRYNVPDFNAFYRFLKDHSEYKVVYAYNQWAGSYLKQAKKCGVPYRIANARTSVQTKSLKNAIKSLAKLNANKYATYRFAVSRKAAKWLFGSNTKDVIIWPNAIDTKKMAFIPDVRESVRKELGLNGELSVIHVGNIRFEKNHTFLLSVFAEIKKRKTDAKLILIGGGDFSTLKDKIKELKIEESVYYLGVRADVERLLQAGDVLVFPSLYEGFPGAVLEAEASGLNCVISDSITDEVMLSDHIVMMSLKKDARSWADKALSMESADRLNAWKTIKDAGYDINDLKNNTEAFYEHIKTGGNQK